MEDKDRVTLDIMAVDDLVMQGVRASAGMPLTLFSQNILVSALEGLKSIWL